MNTGEKNTGYGNSGNRNSGNYNSGNYNSGDYNSGDYNSGNYNSGDDNSGHDNSGHRNSGNGNSGNGNSGNGNSGHCNSGNGNSGIFNTDEPKMRLFNKECDMTFTEWVNSDLYIFFNIPLNTYVFYSEMTDEEKKEHEYAKTTGGYLKTLEYKDAWAKWWEDNTDKHEKVKKLPNFDSAIFEEITGINVETQVEEMTMEEVCKALGKTIKIKK